VPIFSIKKVKDYTLNSILYKPGHWQPTTRYFVDFTNTVLEDFIILGFVNCEPLLQLQTTYLY
jgi:hypothetical protein